jgi:putative transposase
LLAHHELEASMSGVGNCYDNAVVESFFSTLKRELIHHTAYKTASSAESVGAFRLRQVPKDV